MAGEVAKSQVTAKDVYQVAGCASRVLQVGRDGHTWLLTRDDLRAIDEVLDCSLDELSPMVTWAIAAALDQKKPRPSVDDDFDEAQSNLDRALAWLVGIDTSRPSAVCGGACGWVGR